MEYSFKELYDVVLKATYPIEIGKRKIQTGEVISSFDSIQIADLRENKVIKTASGGFDDRGYVFWENTKGLDLIFAQGVFSQEQFALMNNANLINKENEHLLVHKRVVKETDENGSIILEDKSDDYIFCYDENYNKIDNFTINGNVITFKEPYKNIIIDYNIDYFNHYTVLKVGQQLINGFVLLEGKTRIKDTDGQIHTGIIRIPKLKILSGLSMRLGKNANPIVGTMKATATPEGYHGNSKVMEMFILDDDIDSDM